MRRSRFWTLAVLAGSALLLGSCLSASLLPDGRVLLLTPVGGKIYDPASGTIADNGTFALTDIRVFGSSTPLSDGRVLLAGGQASADPTAAASGETAPPLATAAIYDSTTGTLTPTGSMNEGRALHTGTLLQDGMVLVAGGGEFNMSSDGESNPPLKSAELWDPATGQWTKTGDMTEPRGFQTATLLQDGKVLMAGGSESTNGTTAELYDPGSRAFAATGSLQHARLFHTATLLNDGKVLIVGGSGQQLDLSGGTSEPVLVSELYDPGAGTFTETGALATARLFHSAVRLADGRVAVIGGVSSEGLQTPATPVEVYDPSTGEFTDVGEVPVMYAAPALTLLPDGKVLVAAAASDTTAGVTNPADAFAVYAGTWDPATGEYVSIVDPPPSMTGS
jgi:hypothetical protein